MNYKSEVTYLLNVDYGNMTIMTWSLSIAIASLKWGLEYNIFSYKWVKYKKFNVTRLPN